MVTVGVLARLEAKPGKEEEVARFLEGALPLASEVDGRAGASRRPGVVRLGAGASSTYLVHFATFTRAKARFPGYHLHQPC